MNMKHPATPSQAPPGEEPPHRAPPTPNSGGLNDEVGDIDTDEDEETGLPGKVGGGLAGG